jgi:hypothetical protein
VLFHPRAVTPLGSSPRARIAASVHYACSHLCVCARVSTWVIKSIAHTKRVASRSIIRHLLRESRQESPPRFCVGAKGNSLPGNSLPNETHKKRRQREHPMQTSRLAWWIYDLSLRSEIGAIPGF